MAEQATTVLADRSVTVTDPRPFLADVAGLSARQQTGQDCGRPPSPRPLPHATAELRQWAAPQHHPTPHEEVAVHDSSSMDDGKHAGPPQDKPWTPPPTPPSPDGSRPQPK